MKISDHIVRFKEVNVSKNMTAQLDKYQVVPGETGELTVTFSVDTTRPGMHKSGVSVETDEARELDTLDVKTVIPGHARIVIPQNSYRFLDSARNDNEPLCSPCSRVSEASGR